MIFPPAIVTTSFGSIPHSSAIHFMFHICRRVVHPLEILLELIFIDLNPYCLTYITYRDSLLTDEG